MGKSERELSPIELTELTELVRHSSDNRKNYLLTLYVQSPDQLSDVEKIAVTYFLRGLSLDNENLTEVQRLALEKSESEKPRSSRQNVQEQGEEDGIMALQKNGFSEVHSSDLDKGIVEKTYYSKECKAFCSVTFKDGVRTNPNGIVVYPRVLEDGRLIISVIPVDEDIRTNIERTRGGRKVTQFPNILKEQVVGFATSRRFGDRDLEDDEQMEDCRRIGAQVLKEICAAHPEIKNDLGQENLEILYRDLSRGKKREVSDEGKKGQEK